MKSKFVFLLGLMPSVFTGLSSAHNAGSEVQMPSAEVMCSKQSLWRRLWPTQWKTWNQGFRSRNGKKCNTEAICKRAQEICLKDGQDPYGFRESHCYRKCKNLIPTIWDAYGSLSLEDKTLVDQLGNLIKKHSADLSSLSIEAFPEPLRTQFLALDPNSLAIQALSFASGIPVSTLDSLVARLKNVQKNLETLNVQQEKKPRTRWEMYEDAYKQDILNEPVDQYDQSEEEALDPDRDDLTAQTEESYETLGIWSNASQEEIRSAYTDKFLENQCWRKESPECIKIAKAYAHLKKNHSPSQHKFQRKGSFYESIF